MRQEQDWSSRVDGRQVRASFTEDAITVYQAYSEAIAGPAVRAGRFLRPFKRGRMTWIKPSFLWMMYRSGWATKPGQERILAVDITRSGFDWALAHSVLTRFHPEIHGSKEVWEARKQTSPVRIQWDPDRDVELRERPVRAIQIGLGGEAVDRYVDEWTIAIRDVTDLAHRIRDLTIRGHKAAATELLPEERLYPVPLDVGSQIGSTSLVAE